MGRVNIERRRKKSKKSWHPASCDTQFLRENQPRQKSGDAVACANFAPVRLHHLIRHKGINTWQIIAQRRRNGGGSYSYSINGNWAQLADVSRFGDYF